MTAVRGLTWDHPRGYAALAAAAGAATGGLEITWDAQPLAGFEDAPIAELARSYDLIVLDHPHVGEAVAAGCLVPVDELLSDEAVERIAARTVGAAAASYAYGGRTWALPLDAATQVQALQPGLMGDRPAPATWDDVLALAAELPLALSLAGPHALLTFFSICAGLAGGALASTPEAPVPAEAGVAASRRPRTLPDRSTRPAAILVPPMSIPSASEVTSRRPGSRRPGSCSGRRGRWCGRTRSRARGARSSRA